MLERVRSDPRTKDLKVLLATATDIDLPMLFLSGTRDGLATPDLLEELVARLPRAELHWLDTADHGYKILKRTRQSAEDVFDELARVAAAFMREHSG